MNETVVSYAVQNGPWAVASIFAGFLLYKWGSQLVAAQVESLKKQTAATEATSQAVIEAHNAIESLATLADKADTSRRREIKALECIVQACRELEDNEEARRWLDQAAAHLAGAIDA